MARAHAKLLLLTALLTGCGDLGAGQRTPPSYPPPAPLRSAELRRLLIGRTLIHDVDRAIAEGSLAVMTPYREHYAEDGRVAVTQQRAGKGGRYKIVNGRLCTEILSERRCRRIYRSARGLIQRDESTGEQNPIIVEGAGPDR